MAKYSLVDSKVGMPCWYRHHLNGESRKRDVGPPSPELLLRVLAAESRKLRIRHWRAREG